MAVREKPWTYEDYLSLEEEKRYEIIDGELLEMPAPSLRHQKIVGMLYRLLSQHVEEKALGEVYISPVDVVLSPYHVVQPDIVLVLKENYHTLKENSIHGSPDLVVEVVSPSTFKRDTEDKRRLYAKYGVKEYWLVFPEERVVEVLTLEGNEYEVFSHAFESGKVCSKLLEDFCLNLEGVFGAVVER